MSKKSARVQPSLDDLRRTNERPGDLLAARPLLVGTRCGVVKDLRAVPRDVTEPAEPHVYRAQLANHRFVDDSADDLVASGKGVTHGAAVVSALGEAVERYSSACWGGEDVVYGARSEVDGDALDPRDLVLYRPEQYADVEYAPYRDETELGWVPARSLVSGGELFVPALAVSMAHHVHSPGEYLFRPTSNGLATGSTLSRAILAAALEVIERDAFVVAWSNRLPCDLADPKSHPDAAVRRLYHAYLRRGVALSLHRLPSDHPIHVFLALAIDRAADDAPAAVVGLGADFDAARAATKAALEVGQVRPSLRMRLREPETRRRLQELVADPHAVAELEDHDLLYAAPELLHAFDFLHRDSLATLSRPEPREPEPEVDRLGRLVEHLRTAGQDLLYVNLTSPDMGGLGLHTVRVLIPRFQPIDFGWKEQRLGGERLFELPVRLGFTSVPTAPETLNSFPHPLA